MKKVLKQVARIPLALFLAFIFLSIGARIYCEIDYRSVVNSRPPKTTAESIADFNANKEKFEAVKDYILTENKNLYLTHENYEEEVHDENVKSHLEFIFTQLKYSCVSQDENADIYFSYARKDNARSGIVYSEDLDLPALYTHSNLGGNWNEYFIGYSYDRNPVAEISLAIRWTIYFIFSIGLYLVLGLIPPFKKRKLPIDV